jgi:hypothetical protein
LHLEARRHDHRLGGLFGREAGVRIECVLLRHGQLGRQRLELRPLRVKAEVVEVDVPPAAGVLIDQADEDFLALLGRQIDDTGRRFSSFLPERVKNTRLSSAVTNSTRVSRCDPPPSRKLA